MKNIFNLMGEYLKKHFSYIIVCLVSVSIFFLVFILYRLPLEAVLYAIVLAGVFLLGAAAISYINFCRRHKELKKIGNSITFEMNLPEPKDLIEKDYQELIRIIDENRTRIISENDKSFTDMVDYYTIWAHQIKTPIAAMRLLIQSEQSDLNNDLSEQLFKVEQYVEMVLQYLRVESMNSDLLIKKYPLDDIVKQAIRKYSKIFIKNRIRLNYNSLNYEVITDEKWLAFVLEQILSNALKYTPEGEISIYMDPESPDTLVIEDTGIGIKKEDLPRVFEKGFTGYNGRADKKSTGIGLYLCKRIFNKLLHFISIDSEVGRGTKVKIRFDTVDISGD